MNSKYYQPSGKASLSGILTMILGGLIVALITSPIYVFAVQHLGQFSVYICILATIGYAFVTGFAMSFLAKKGHLRSPKKIMVLSFLVGLVAVWLQWVFFYSYIVNNFGEGPPLASVYTAALLDPSHVFEMMEIYYTDGAWSLGENGSPMKGIPLAFCWVAEAAIISIIPAYIARSQARKPYSEQLLRWADNTVLPKKAPFIENSAQNKQMLENGDFSLLTGDGLSDACTYIHLWEAEGDDTCFYLTLKNSKIVQNKSKQETKTQTVIEYLKISPESAIDLKLKFSQ